MLDSKLHFHHHVDCLNSQALKLLGLIRFSSCNSYSLDNVKVSYITVICSKIVHAPAVWNNFTFSESFK
jgi:hypothetical protein